MQYITLAILYPYIIMAYFLPSLLRPTKKTMNYLCFCITAFIIVSAVFVLFE